MTEINSSSSTAETNRAERREPPPPPVQEAKKPVEAQQKSRDDDNAAAVARVEQARPAAKEIAGTQAAQFRSQPAMPGANDARRPPQRAPQRAPQRPPQQPVRPQHPQRQPSTREAAQNALRETKPVAASDPHKQHIDAVRSQLDEAGLPSSAPHTRLVVNDQGDHGRAVTRAAVGDVGPGRGAETHLQEVRNDPQSQQALHHDAATNDRLASIDRAGRALERGNASLDQLGTMGTNILEGMVHQHRAELGRVRELAQKENKANGEKPTVANMSWGTSVQQVALGNPGEPGLAAAAVHAPKGSPLHKELTKELGHAPSQRDIPAVSKMIAERMQKTMDDKEAGAGLRGAKEKLGNELKEAAEKDKVHVVAAMGNQQEHATRGMGNESWGSSIIHDVPNHISVGASDLGKDPKKVGDERISSFSSAGQVEVAAPGVQSPVGTPKKPGGAPAKWDGTSFSSPYVAGTVALMLQANPNLTSQQIRETLQGTAHDIKGTERDGAGVVDPVAAVRRARELAAAH